MKVTVARVLYLAPVVAIAAYGAWWIAAHAGVGRTATHTLWQSLTLTEITVALPLRAQAGRCARGHPGRVPDLRPALADPAADAAHAADGGGGPRSSHGDRRRRRGRGGDHGSTLSPRRQGSFAGYTLFLLGAAGVAVAVGTYLRLARARAAG